MKVITDQGEEKYKRPDDVDVNLDEICIASDGTPVTMKGSPGRPKKNSGLKPVTPQIAQVEAQRDEHLQLEAVSVEVGKDPDSEDVFKALMSGMAAEAASIEFDRMEAQRNGENATNHAAKRARILKAMADLHLKRKQQQEGGMIDLEGPPFQAIFALILETFRDVLEAAGTRPEHVDTVFAKLVSELGDDTWKEEAKSRMKEKMR